MLDKYKTELEEIYNGKKQFSDYPEIEEIIIREWWDYIPENWYNLTDKELNKILYNLIWS